MGPRGVARGAEPQGAEGLLTGPWLHVELECLGHGGSCRWPTGWWGNGWHPPSTSWLIWAGLQAPLSLSFLLCKMGVMVTARQDH